MKRRRSVGESEQGDVDIARLLGGSGFDDEDKSSTGPQDISSHTSLVDIVANGSSDDDDEAFIAAQQAISNKKTVQVNGKGSKKSGGFQYMGLNPALLKAITRKGFSVPTPIQRKTVPFILDRQDVVGMARTGSGKTAAFVIPMIERLKAHSVTVGARALVLSPSRELALQTSKAVKEFGRGTDLRAVLIVGGDSLDEQFKQMTSNPDIIVATPGRFLHLLVEMSLDLSCVKYAVFDEADRLFEMGFATQLHEILHALPASRQTLLFSATLPQSLVEFARAGLRDPNLIRLDAETKISPDLQSAFITMKSADKEGALLNLLNNVIKMPLGQAHKDAQAANTKERKRDAAPSNAVDPPTAHSSIVFAATKHHVEYLQSLLNAAGFAVSYVYGSLDQTARKIQVDQFRSGATSLLVVTDVAARGIDIPMLANVINYDFPSQPKIFVHRVGRTARAGRHGWSYSFVSDSDLPYLLDLQLFLGKTLVKGSKVFRDSSFAEAIVLGSTPRTSLEPNSEHIIKLLAEDEDLSAQRIVATKGEKLYLRTRNAASAESAKRAKKLAFDPDMQETNPIFGLVQGSVSGLKDEMLAKISGFRPIETVFEIGKRGVSTAVGQALEKQRRKLEMRRVKIASKQLPNADRNDVGDDEPKGDSLGPEHQESSSEEGGHENVLSNSNATDAVDLIAWQDHNEDFMSYKPRAINVAEDRGYGVESGSYNTGGKSNFVDAARGATMDLAADESRAFGEPSKMRWDKSSKKYVARANDNDGSKRRKTITGESGQKLNASFRSGRFDAWRKSNRMGRMPKAGEQERADAGQSRPANKKFKHYAERAAKQPDKYRDDYYTKKKKLAEKVANGGTGPGSRNVRSEIRGVEDVRKQRQFKQKQRDKNARPSKKEKRA